MKTKNIKPFDLEAALRGEPVMLRNGQKAFVRHHETELLVDYSTKMFGYTLRDNGGALLSSWGEDGRYFGNHLAHRDIIGMYPKTRIINGFEVPAPETVEPASVADCFIPTLTNECLYGYENWSGHRVHRKWLERGLVFLTKEDAIANAKAMLGINPYEDSE